MWQATFLHFHEFYCTRIIKHPIIQAENKFFLFSLCSIDIFLHSTKWRLSRNSRYTLRELCGVVDSSALHSTVESNQSCRKFQMLWNVFARCFENRIFCSYVKIARNLHLPHHMCLVQSSIVVSDLANLAFRSHTLKQKIAIKISLLRFVLACIFFHYSRARVTQRIKHENELAKNIFSLFLFDIYDFGWFGRRSRWWGKERRCISVRFCFPTKIGN